MPAISIDRVCALSMALVCAVCIATAVTGAEPATWAALACLTGICALVMAISPHTIRRLTRSSSPKGGDNV